MCNNTIYTIGHSTHDIDHFIRILKNFGITYVADIRRFPWSRRYPHFKKDLLRSSLKNAGIEYAHHVDLGGRRNPVADSHNSAWRVNAFRGYADYMETSSFSEAIETLQQIANTHCVAYMCAEAVWWSCHRALVSDYLKHRGWNVIHIMGIDKSQEHPYTKAASFKNGNLSYRSVDLFNE